MDTVLRTVTQDCHSTAQATIASQLQLQSLLTNINEQLEMLNHNEL